MKREAGGGRRRHGGGIDTVSDHNATELILGPLTVQDDAQSQHDPWQPGSAKDKQAEEAELGIGVASGPDVDEGAAQGAPQESDGQQRGQAQEGGGGIGEQPSKVGARGGRLLKHAGIALDEEDVEQQTQGQGPEVEKGGGEAPVLAL